jgi:ribosomal protein L18E
MVVQTKITMWCDREVMEKREGIMAVALHYSRGARSKIVHADLKWR